MKFLWILLQPHTQELNSTEHLWIISYRWQQVSKSLIWFVLRCCLHVHMCVDMNGTHFVKINDEII